VSAGIPAGIGLASVVGVLHIVDFDAAVPTLPPHRWTRTVAQLSYSAGLHLATLAAVTVLAAQSLAPPTARPAFSAIATPVDIRHIVFIARDPNASGGGGGGGNRQTAPIRRAQGVGADRITLRVAKPR